MEVTLLTRSTFSLLAFMKGQGDGSFKAVSRIQLFPNSYCFDNIFIILRCLLMFLLRPDSHKTFYCRRPNGDSPATLNFLMKHVIPSASDPPGTHRRHGRKFETCSNFFPLRCQRPRKIHMETWLRWVASGSPAVSEVQYYQKRLSFQFHFKTLYGGELIARGSPVSKKYVQTCFSSNVAGGSPTLESYMETRFYIHVLQWIIRLWRFTSHITANMSWVTYAVQALRDLIGSFTEWRRAKQKG